MAFPAGILQAPYFSKDYPEYLGFGAMSSLSGHELTVSHASTQHRTGEYPDITPCSTLSTQPEDNSTRPAS